MNLEKQYRNKWVPASHAFLGVHCLDLVAENKGEAEPYSRICEKIIGNSAVDDPASQWNKWPDTKPDRNCDCILVLETPDNRYMDVGFLHGNSWVRNMQEAGIGRVTHWRYIPDYPSSSD